MLAGVALSFLPYLVFRTLIRQRPAERLTRLLARLPRLQPTLGGWVEGARRLDREVRQFWTTHRRAYLLVFLFVFAARLLGVATLVVLARSAGSAQRCGQHCFSLRHLDRWPNT